MKRTFANQFGPEYHNIPQMPEGFTDESWGNDVCPHFELQIRGAGRVELWIDAEDASLREMRGARFTAYYSETEEYGAGETVAEADTWDTFLTMVANFLLELADAVQGQNPKESELRAASTLVWLCTDDGRAELAADAQDNAERGSN